MDTKRGTSYTIYGLGRSRIRKRPAVCVVTVSPVMDNIAEEEHPAKKRLRAIHSISKKKEVVDYAKSTSMYQASKVYGLSTGTIWPWMKIDFSKTKASVYSKKKSGRKLSYPIEKEEKLVEWVLEQRDLHLTVSIQDILDKGVEVIKPANGVLSRGWFQKFMRRNNLTLSCSAKLSVAQKLPAALEAKVSSFLASVKDARKATIYSPDLIGNMDETHVYFDMASNKMDVKRMKTCSTGAQIRLTVVLSATADGHMLPAMVIFKGVKVPKSLNVPSGWIVCVQKKGWMDENLMERWVREVWLKHTKCSKALLVMDCFSAHCTDGIKDLLVCNNTAVAVIPGGCTSRLQPMDVSLNRPFKAVCWGKCSEFCSKWLACTTGPTSHLKTASKQEVIEWLVSAQSHLSSHPRMIVKSFKVTGISLAMDGSEDELLHSDVALQEDEGTGDPYLGLEDEEEDSFIDVENYEDEEEEQKYSGRDSGEEDDD